MLSRPDSNSGRKKTDLTLGKTERPNLNSRGDVMTFRFAEPTDRPTSGANTGKDCGRTTLAARDRRCRSGPQEPWRARLPESALTGFSNVIRRMPGSA